MRRKVLLGCGIVSSVLYVSADIVATLRYEGYRYTEQQISELMATGAPTRPLLVSLFTPYNALVAAFGGGVWTAAHERRAGRITGALLIGYATVGQAALLFFPMHTREALAAGERGLPNAMHPVATGVMSLLVVLAMGFGATLLGRWFRAYSYATIATLVVFGLLVSMQASKMVADKPTPWMGIEERVIIYAMMLWLAVLAIGLLRAEGADAARRRKASAAHPPVMQGVVR